MKRRKNIKIPVGDTEKQIYSIGMLKFKEDDLAYRTTKDTLEIWNTDTEKWEIILEYIYA